MRAWIVVLPVTVALCACGARAPLPPPPALFPLHEDWRLEKALPSEAAAGTALATDGESVFFSPSAEAIAAIDPTTGLERWRATASPGVVTARAGLLVLRHADGLVDGFDSRTGRAIWTLKTGIAGEVPTAVTGLHVVLAGRGIAVLDAASGEKVWALRGLGRFTTSPLVIGPRVLAATQEGKLYCLDLATGRTLWTYGTHVAGVSPFVVDDDGRVFWGTSDGLLVALRLVSGHRLWQRRIGAATAEPGIILKSTVCFGTYGAVLQTVKRSNGDFAWRSGLPSRPLSAPFLQGDGILIACYGSQANRTTFVAVDAKTGKRRGVYDLTGEIASPPLFLAGRFVVALRSGAVVGLSFAPPAAASPTPGSIRPPDSPSPAATPTPATSPAARS